MYFFELCNRPLIKMERIQILFTSNSVEIRYEAPGECPSSGWKKSLSCEPGYMEKAFHS